MTSSQHRPVGRMCWIAARERDGAVRGHSELATVGVRTIELAARQPGYNRLDMAVERQSRDFYDRLVDVADVQTATVSRPLCRFHGAIEAVGERARILPVRVHYVHMRVLIPELSVLEAHVGDLRAVGRDAGLLERTLTVDQGRQRPIGDGDAINLRAQRIEAPVVMPIAAQ